MGDDEQTRFHFDFGGIRLELSGDRDFVQTMYRRVMRDVDVVQRRITKRRSAIDETLEGATLEELSDSAAERPSVWLHRCGSMMRKIYMASRTDVSDSPIGECIDVDAVTNVYMQKSIFNRFFPDLEGERTLWAEFTKVGRQKIAGVKREG